MPEESTALVAYDQAMYPNLLNQDPRAVMDRIAARFQQATSLDDLFNVLEGKTSDDMIGRAITVQSVAWAPYESDRGIIPLAVCQAVDSDGEVFEFATTGEVLCLFIRHAELIPGCMPFTARITGKKTSSGQTALNFERV